MEANTDSTPTQYRQVTVDVPEKRVAEFHRFFGRFLAGGPRRGPGGRRGRHAHGGHCRGRRSESETGAAAPEDTNL